MTESAKTPRTDAVVIVSDGADGWGQIVDADFARQLERELAEATKCCDSYAKENQQLSDRAEVAEKELAIQDAANDILTRCRKDAERYRWIRSKTGAVMMYGHKQFRYAIWMDDVFLASRGLDLLQGSVAEHLDAAIDMAKGEG